MEQAADEDEEPPADATAADAGEDFLLTDTADDLDLRLARLEHLMERRPELLSSVMLRQNPHNVHEWHKRAKLFQANPTKQIICYTGGWVGGWAQWRVCGYRGFSALLMLMLVALLLEHAAARSVPPKPQDVMLNPPEFIRCMPLPAACPACPAWCRGCEDCCLRQGHGQAAHPVGRLCQAV